MNSQLLYFNIHLLSHYDCKYCSTIPKSNRTSLVHPKAFIARHFWNYCTHSAGNRLGHPLPAFSFFCCSSFRNPTISFWKRNNLQHFQQALHIEKHLDGRNRLVPAGSFLPHVARGSSRGEEFDSWIAHHLGWGSFHDLVLYFFSAKRVLRIKISYLLNIGQSPHIPCRWAYFPPGRSLWQQSPSHLSILMTAITLIDTL